ncbi:MAG: hypothetical protein HC830_08775, partial [Bacteroidetes bacterium]|nr:hypothetical protein [Bacteroidota bacterium]
AKEKEEAEKAFVDSQEKYEEIVENANTAILKLDLQGNILFLTSMPKHFLGLKKMK